MALRMPISKALLLALNVSAFWRSASCSGACRVACQGRPCSLPRNCNWVACSCACQPLGSMPAWPWSASCSAKPFCCACVWALSCSLANVPCRAMRVLRMVVMAGAGVVALVAVALLFAFWAEDAASGLACRVMAGASRLALSCNVLPCACQPPRQWAASVAVPLAWYWCRAGAVVYGASQSRVFCMSLALMCSCPCPLAGAIWPLSCACAPGAASCRSVCAVWVWVW